MNWHVDLSSLANICSICEEPDLDSFVSESIFFPLGKPFRRAIREELNSLVSETTTVELHQK